MQHITAIYAVSTNNVIGINVAGKEKLPWNLKQDLTFFRSMTEGEIVVMGMKTFESMGSKPLPNRVNIILTRRNDLESTSTLIFSDLAGVDKFLQDYDGRRRVFVIGGVETFNLLSNRIKEAYVTHVDAIIDFDKMTFMHRNLLTGKQSELIMTSNTDEYPFSVVHYFEKSMLED